MFFLFSSCKKIIVCYYALAMITQIHLFDKISNQTIYKGVAHINDLKNDGYQLQFNKDEHQFTWNIYKGGLLICSQSEMLVKLPLRLERKTKGHIETEFGVIDLECETKKYDTQPDCVEIEYTLLQGNDKQHFHFVMMINKEGTYAIH